VPVKPGFILRNRQGGGGAFGNGLFPLLAEDDKQAGSDNQQKNGNEDRKCSHLF